MGLNMTRLSVLIPAYHASAYIDRCLESVCRQKYPDAEFIVRDDHSGDDTAARIRAWAARDARIRPEVNETRLGRIGNYRRLLYEDSRGEFIFVLDGDDHIEDSDFLERMMKPLEQSPSVVASISCMTILLPADRPICINRLALNRIRPDASRVLSRPEVFQILRSDQIWDLHGNTVARKSFVLKTGVYERVWPMEISILPFLGDGDRLALVDARGVVWTKKAGSEAAKREQGAMLPVLYDLVAYLRGLRPGLTDYELAVVIPGWWVNLDWKDLYRYWRETLRKSPFVPGTLRAAWKSVCIRISRTFRRKFSFGSVEIPF